MKTATIHNPTNFEPADYTVLDYYDNRRPQYCGESVEAFAETVKFWELDMLNAFGDTWRAKIHRCVHCGNGNVRWITAVRHEPTGDVVVFGSDCTERLGFTNRVAFKLAQVQARAEARKVRFTIYNKRVEFLAANPAIADALAKIDNPAHARNFFAKDVLSKLDKYGSLSPAQVNAVVASMKRDEETAARMATEAAEPKGDAPAGRVEITGVVLSVKETENAFGFVRKMLVKLPNNSKVWVTVPGGSTIERNDTITVRATFTVSDTDKSFAFGSRPTLINHVSAAATV